MNRFIGLIITVVAIAALIGAAIGWKFPFLGQNQRANQLTAQQNNQQGQPANRRRVQGASQPATAVQDSNNSTTAQATNDNVNSQDTNTDQSGQSNQNQSVPALW